VQNPPSGGACHVPQLGYLHYHPRRRERQFTFHFTVNWSDKAIGLARARQSGERPAERTYTQTMNVFEHTKIKALAAGTT